MAHPLCGYSLQKGSRIIAIADLVICILSITFRMIVYDYMEYYHQGDLKEISRSNATSGEKIKLAMDALKLNETETVELLDFARSFSVTVFIVQVIVAFLAFLVYILLEIWLCRLLISASKNRDGAACKMWFWVRLTITIFILMFSILGIATLQYDWADWALEPINLYRIYELIVVNEFRKEIAGTSGRVKMRA